MTAEQEIHANATTPRITPEHIGRCIVRSQYHQFPGTTVTVITHQENSDV